MSRSRRGAEEPARDATATGSARLLPDLDRPGALLLTLDGTPQSYVDPADPTRIEFDYVRRLAHLVDTAFPADAPLTAVHLGAGALSLPRYIAHTRPGSEQLAVEIDEPLIAFVREHLPWDKRWRLRVRASDARAALESRRPASADLVVADVFAGARTPAHLTSVEFLQQAARVLRPGGVYAANIADGAGARSPDGPATRPAMTRADSAEADGSGKAGADASGPARTTPLAFARGQAATASAVFPHVLLIAEPAVLRGRRFGNLVLAAAAAPLPVAQLVRRTAGDAFPARVLEGAELGAWIGGAAPVTDAVARPSPAPPPGAFEV